MATIDVPLSGTVLALLPQRACVRDGQSGPLLPTERHPCIEQVRQDGFASDHEELRRGVNCVAVPILGSRTGRAIAAAPA